MPDLEELSTVELKKLVKEVPRLIEARRSEEREKLRVELEQIANERGFKLRELVATAPKQRRQRVAGQAKYRSKVDPSKTWAGIGRRPAWVSDHLDSGGALEDLEIRGSGSYR